MSSTEHPNRNAPAQQSWGGRFAEGPSQLMQRFSESVSFDSRLASFDIRGSKAHARMLQEVGILTPSEADDICNGLDALLKEIESGRFQWKVELEDVHMNIEHALTSRVPAAAKLHTARSRNDQIATDMRLWFRFACNRLMDGLRRVIHALAVKASETRTLALPGYTHLQRAQPVSMAHHLLAYCEMFSRDRERLADALERGNVCPLGSGAIAGTTLPIDRSITARLLEFTDASGAPRMTQNSMDAVADRDLFIEFASACALIGMHFSRLGEDMILWSSSEFGFIRLPDAFSTGSSLMPQKKNPDSFELLRGKAARLQGNLQTLLSLCKNLPLTYNRDLQEDKPPVFDSFDQTDLCLEVLAASIAGIQPNPARCAAAVADPMLLATDLADYLVRKGMPFREAHHTIGRLVALSEARQCPINTLGDEDVRSVSPCFESDWRGIFDTARAFRLREKTGMPGHEQVNARIQHWLECTR